MIGQRVIPLAGIHNFRDYGGYDADGGRVRTGVLFRSGQHVDATDADLAAVAALDIGTVVDLRGDSERRLYPCRRANGFAAEIVFTDGETTGSDPVAPHEEVARVVRTASDAHRRMAELYKSMPFRPVLAAALQHYFAALADRDGVNLVHCLAGKDRTGIAVAVLHDLLGVHPDDIMADYLLTNTAGNIERRLAAGARMIRAGVGRDMDDDAVRTVMSVHPEYLDNAFAAIHAEHGSVAAYAEARLDVLPVMRARLIARYVA